MHFPVALSGTRIFYAKDKVGGETGKYSPNALGMVGAKKNNKVFDKYLLVSYQLATERIAIVVMV